MFVLRRAINHLCFVAVGPHIRRHVCFLCSGRAREETPRL